MPRRAATEHVDVRELIPDDPDLDQLRDISQGCTGCDLYHQADSERVGFWSESASPS
jgi:hypothetical protein